MRPDPSGLRSEARRVTLDGTLDDERTYPYQEATEQMAVSPKMLAVLQKVEAARAQFLDGLRQSAKREARLRAATKQAMSAKRKPPMKKPPLRETSPAGKKRAG